MLLIYTTHPSKAHAEKISKALLESRLIACANIFPIGSIYWGDEKIESNDEFVAILKTQESKADEVEKKIKELHDYKVPCIIRFSAQSNPEFETWCSQETAKGRQDR